jgi:hypothetical protein
VDLFVLMDVLEHVRDDFAFLSDLLGRAAAGTQFLIAVPADMRLWSPHDEVVCHYRRYDRARLERLWQGLPVSVRLLSYANARLYWPVRLVRQVARLRGKAAGAAGTDFTLPPGPVNRALARCFAGETKRLLRGIDVPGAYPYRYGASLVAILRREAGRASARSKPADVAADAFDPEARRAA